MYKTYKQILILTLLCFYLSGYSQNKREITCLDILKITDEEMNLVNLKMDELIKENEYLSSFENLQKLYVFWMNDKNIYDDDTNKKIIIKEDLINQFFFHNLKPSLHYKYVESISKKRKLTYNKAKNDLLTIPILQADCFIFDSLGNYLGRTESDRVHIYINAPKELSSRYSAIYKLILFKDIECVFRVNNIANTYFGIKNGEIVCIYLGDKYDIAIYSIEDFVYHYWDSPLVFNMFKFVYDIKD